MLIAQLSDIHVRPRGKLYQDVVDSNRMFAQAVARLNGFDPRPDLVLISGDLVDEGRPDEYEMLVELLRPLAIPFVVLPGNHDDDDGFRRAFPGHGYLPASGPMHYCVDDHPLKIVALDTCVHGEHHGRVDAAGLRWLERTLARDRHRPTLVFLHHPPFLCGIPSLDQYRLFDQAPLESIIASFDHIEAVLCGHVHRPMFRRWGKTVAAACPSTTTQIALQFRPDATPKSYEGPAACLLHLWNEAGLISHVHYLDEYPGPYPFG